MEIISIIVAILGFAGAILGAIIFGIVIFFVVKSNHKADKETTNKMLSTQYITDKRIQWISELRSEIAIFATNVRVLIGYINNNYNSFSKAQQPNTITEMLRSGMFVN